MNRVEIKQIPSKVKITVSEKPMSLPEHLQESIQSYWDSLIECGKTFQRGDVFSIKDIKEKQDELLITLHKTDYGRTFYILSILRPLSMPNVLLSLLTDL